MTPYRFAFVIEQGLGHVVHGMNLEMVLKGEPDIEGTVLKVKPGDRSGGRPIPLVKNWSVQTSLAARRVLRRTQDSQPVDAVFIHTQVDALFARKVMRRVPTIVSLDATPMNFDSMALAYGHSLQPKALEWAKLQVNRRALSGAASVVTWSHWAAQSVSRDYLYPADRVHPIYPGVELARFRPRTRDRRPGPVRILFVGGDFRRKGGPDLIQAVQRVQRPVELHIVSSSHDIHVPESLLCQVHREVMPNSDAMLELFSTADLFALPSRGDCTPLAIAEAMACGLPIVATNVGSIPDMVKHGENGLLVAPERPAELASALETLAQDASMRRRMGLASRCLAEQDHDTTKNWRAIFEVMRSVADDGFSPNRM